MKGKAYKAYVQRVLVYGSETWPVKSEDMQRLERTERLMVRWMCGVSLKNRISSEDLNRRLGVERVADVVRCGRLRWFGHLERKNSDDWVSACRNFVMAGPKGKGRSKKTWDECVRHDLRLVGLKAEWAQNKYGRNKLEGTVQPVQAWKEGR